MMKSKFKIQFIRSFKIGEIPYVYEHIEAAYKKASKNANGDNELCQRLFFEYLPDWNKKIKNTTLQYIQEASVQIEYLSIDTKSITLISADTPDNIMKCDFDGDVKVMSVKYNCYEVFSDKIFLCTKEDCRVLKFIDAKDRNLQCLIAN